jgi:hypothetical protein
MAPVLYRCPNTGPKCSGVGGGRLARSGRQSAKVMLRRNQNLACGTFQLDTIPNEGNTDWDQLRHATVVYPLSITKWRMIASTITVSSDVVSTLMRMGSLKKSDFRGSKTYVLADGSSVTSETFTIKFLRVGGALVENVEASVAPTAGPLLLGQTFLQRFKAWTIDNSKHELLLAIA